MPTIRPFRFTPEDHHSPATLSAVEKLRAQVASADALMIANPEYNYCVTGVLKNAIDWLSRTSPQSFREKPVALTSATQGPVVGARNQYELRKILNGLKALVLNKPEIFIGMCQNRFDAKGKLTDAATCKLIGDQMLALQAWFQRIKHFSAKWETACQRY